MLAASLPSNEEERLQALERYAILDTLPEAQYDDLTALAAEICGTPIALVSLVARERQWFKSHLGLGVSETPRPQSVCAHAILQEEVFEVPDTLLDARFADSPLVQGEPYMRYYAGAPLVTPDGFRLGTICVLDREPRQLSPGQKNALLVLARQVVAQLELWRTVKQLEVTSLERQLALKRAEKNAVLLKANETQFRLFMDNSPVVAFIKDRQGRYVYFNEPMERTFNLNLDEMRHKTDFDWLPAEVAQLLREHDQNVLQRGETTQHIEIVPTPDGLERSWLVFKFPLGLEDGTVLLGGVALDLTERLHAEKLKSEFVSMVSHELRTPLTSVRGALGLLSAGVAGELPDKAREMVSIADKNVLRLVLLINDLLDIEKIEAGKMRFEMQPLEVKALLEAACEANALFAMGNGVSIELLSPPDVRVLGDEDRLMQVLANLLSNACKWTPRGKKVYVGAERVGAESKGAKRVRFEVRDEGPGVSADFASQLFTKFAQADSSPTRPQGGTGLGLAIVRAIIERHGGEVGYRAPEKEGDGATFWFELPEA